MTYFLVEREDGTLRGPQLEAIQYVLSTHPYTHCIRIDMIPFPDSNSNLHKCKIIQFQQLLANNALKLFYNKGLVNNCDN